MRVEVKLRRRWPQQQIFIDGRSPNSSANVGWILGPHHRAWQERTLFGQVRYMSARGLECESNIKQYVQKVDDLVRQARRESKLA